MAQIHFIGGEKGGVGKSLVARVLAQYLIDHEHPFLGFDTDRSHGALMRFYAGYASPVVVDKYESLDAIVEAAAADPNAASWSTLPHRPRMRSRNGWMNPGCWNSPASWVCPSATGT